MPIPVDNARYFEGMQQGLTGSALGEYAGIPEVQGSSPPTVTPAPAPIPPPMRLDSAANYVRYNPNDDQDAFWSNFERTYANMPVDQAKKAVEVAQQYQATRLFQQKVASGMDPALAAMQVAPGMNRSTLSGIAGLIRATRPKAKWQFVPGEGGAPATFQDVATGQRPEIVAPSALPGPKKGRQTIHAPGVGIFDYDEETGTWNKSVDFGNKATKYPARRVSIDPETGTIKTVSGDPEDPVIKKFMEDTKKASVQGAQKSGSGLAGVWNWLTGGSSSPKVEAPKSGALPRVTTQAEYDVLESGTKYIGKDGKRYTKP